MTTICSIFAIWSTSGVALLTPSLSCGEITVTLEDVANQLLLPILGDVDPSDIQLSTEEEALEAELRKGLSSGNTKFSKLDWGFLESFHCSLLCRLHYILAS